MKFLVSTNMLRHELCQNLSVYRVVQLGLEGEEEDSYQKWGYFSDEFYIKQIKWRWSQTCTRSRGLISSLVGGDHQRVNKEW